MKSKIYAFTIKIGSLSLSGLLAAMMACQPGKTDSAEENVNVESENASRSEYQTSGLVNISDEQMIALANQACDMLQKNLGSQLKGALQAGGPTAALPVCRTVAQPITASTSEALEGITITRTALKVRNPANAPNEKDQKVLQGWMNSMQPGSEQPEPSLVRVSDQETIYYRPIMIQEICLKCHGDPASFPEKLTEQLNALYPDDKATGYLLGELRGAFKVSMKLDEINIVESPNENVIN